MTAIVGVMPISHIHGCVYLHVYIDGEQVMNKLQPAQLMQDYYQGGTVWAG